MTIEAAKSALAYGINVCELAKTKQVHIALNTAMGILELLKQQEYTRFHRISYQDIWECEKCGQNVMTSDIEVYEYCHGCGRKVKWD